MVTIPFNRLDLGDTPPDTPSVTPVVTYSDVNETGQRVLDYCTEPRNSREILEHLGLKDIKNLSGSFDRRQ